LVDRIPVFIDTNFFFVPFRFKVDIFEEFNRILDFSFEIILLSVVQEELVKLTEKNAGKEKREARAALQLARRCKRKEVRAIKGESVDDVILRVAREENGIVATNDKDLRDRLKRENIRIIYLRSKTHLQIS